MVSTKRTIGSDMILAHPILLLSDEAHVESSFGPFGDGVCVSAR
jgi:hypothetical protein